MASANKVRNEAAVFVTTFNACLKAGKGIKDVAKALNITENSVSARATKLRKMGVKLGTMQRGGGRAVDVAALNALLVEPAETEQSETSETAETAEKSAS